MADFKEINGLGASDLAADLAKIMVDDYCRSDNPKARAQQQDDMEFTLEPLLADNKAFHSAIMRTAWWILNNRFEGKRTYILDSEGGIDFHPQRNPKEVITMQAVSDYVAWSNRGDELE